jgi:hypothetical protein
VSTALPDAARAESFRAQMRSGAKTRAYFLAKLPLAWFAGLRVKRLDAQRCEVMVPRGWRTQNPFRSTYFAAQAMAAELATGALCMAAVQGAGVPVSMLVTEMRSTFGKKAVSDAVFTCADGDAVAAAVAETLRTGEGTTVEATAVGRMADGTEVATFVFTWSFKRKADGGANES